MSKYRKKGPVFEACQLGVQDWPEWLWDAYNQGLILKDGSSRYYQRKITLSDASSLIGPLDADVWAVRSPDTNEVSVLSDHEFRGVYEKL